MSDAVSVVVVTFHSERFIAGCLESLDKQTVLPREIVVVDNGSRDETCSIVRNRFPKIHLIEMKSNTGFCRANNVGLKETTGKFSLFCNPDAELAPNYIEEMLKAFAERPRAGMVTGKILRFDRATLDSAGQHLTLGRKIQDRGFGQKDEGQFSAAEQVDAVCGAVAFYRRQMIDEILVDGQLFDEDFFAFGEDMDVGWRARRFGWEAWYVPATVAYHFRGGSQEKHTAWTNLVRMTGRPAELKYHIVKNRWLMMLKNETAPDYILRFPFIFARDVALVWYLILTAPSAFFRLWSDPGCFVRAGIKRRMMEQMLVGVRR